jgi:hypothetical protein
MSNNTEAAPSLEIFKVDCEVRAALFAAGELELHEAVDSLQYAAAASGLVALLGQDAVQAVMAAAFSRRGAMARRVPKVLNIRDGSFPGAVYIGRRDRRSGRQASKWRNRFIIGKDGSREEVIAKFERWLHDDPEGQRLLREIGELRGQDLLCWCAPKACHGDVLLRLANQSEPIPPAIEEVPKPHCELARSVLDAVGYLIKQNDPIRLRAFLARSTTAAERALIKQHFSERRK